MWFHNVPPRTFLGSSWHFVVLERFILADLVVLKARVKRYPQRSVTKCKLQRVCLIKLDRGKAIVYYMEVILVLLSGGNRKGIASGDLYWIWWRVLKTTQPDETCSKSYDAEEFRQCQTPELFSWMWVYLRRRIKQRAEGLKRREGSITPRRGAEDGEASNCHPGPGTLWRLLIGTVCRGL